MINLSLKDIAQITGGELIGDGDVLVSSVLTDSRIIGKSSGTLFFALKTTRNNGHKYIPDLLKNGVNLFVVSEKPRDKKVHGILVEDTLKALQELAFYQRRQLQGKFIAITGSNGKTVVKEWLFQLLSTRFKVYRSPRSYNSQLGVALSLINADHGSEVYIIEAGISQPGEMERLEEMIAPDVAVLTNIGEPHQENFTSYEEKTREKLALFRHAEVKVVPADCVPLQKLLLNNFTGYYAWSYHSSYGASVSVMSTGKKSVLTFKGRINHEVSIPYTDRASIENAITCFFTLHASGFDPKEFEIVFSKLEPVAMRMELKQGINNSILINDSYNSDIGSLAIALDFLLQQAGSGKRIKRVILSDIVQSGKKPEDLYDEVNKLLEEKGIDQLIGVGEAISDHAGLFTIPGHFYKSTGDFLKDIDQFHFSGEAILIKGARRFEFESVTEHLAYKVHKTTLEINLNRLAQNISVFRGMLKPETRIMAMVKAFAYGSGSFEVARHLQFHGVNYLAVAVADEGVELRNAGVTLPIVVMAPEMQSLDTLFRYHLEPEIFSFDILDAVIAEAKALGESSYPVHIKLDTGMHRMGFLPEDVDILIGVINDQNFLKIESVFSHLAAADEADKDDFTMEQIHLFEKNAEKIKSGIGYEFLKHILNSAGSERFTDYQYDMVRLGIGMYGVSAAGNEDLKPVGTFKTMVSAVKKVKKDETVGYGRKGVLTRDSEIAVIPVGYADGLARLLGNRTGYAVINGNKVPYVGNICMDLSMLDVTGLNIKPGDEVILFGDEPHINTVAEWMQTIPYEVITSISQRVKRVFTRE
ncbi:bifunctional UDP-N-acetylmuramoyl-tripeptide:D-alanyl-D-alanine ligase/alanine racemase [Saccharicrinis sp. FJH54]|uniref:bifunctional UDP-N-acetylmuramoyl-tripeptide:D-alanyl-D-alanine ligase/alanine racemase n=1 Tax=Saccharicrinis sp. FJH54 TaxID=3344665 RepID=UPI0035D50F0F